MSSGSREDWREERRGKMREVVRLGRKRVAKRVKR